MDDIPSRVAVLEQIARNTETTLARIEVRLDRIDSRMADDFRFLIRLHIGQFAALAAGFIILLAVMAHGFKWF